MPHTFSCPSNVHWNDDGLEKDLYIQTTTVTVLAMDGRRRWLDIHKLVSFIFNFGIVTVFTPMYVTDGIFLLFLLLHGGKIVSMLKLLFIRGPTERNILFLSQIFPHALGSGFIFGARREL